MGGLEEGAKSREGSSRRQWKPSLPPKGLAGRAWAARALPLPRAAWGAPHLQDEDSDEGDGEDDHHLDELAVSHALLAGEVILQQIGGPISASARKEVFQCPHVEE